MLSYIKSFFWSVPTTTERQQHSPVSSQTVASSGRKRTLPPISSVPHIIKRPRGPDSSSHISWNLYLEQADYTFSQETLAIFKGSGATVLVNSRAKQCRHSPQRAVAGGARPLGPSAPLLWRLPSDFSQRPGDAADKEQQQHPANFAHSRLLLLSDPARTAAPTSLPVLRQLTNLPKPLLSSKPPVATATTASAALLPIVQSTPMMPSKQQKSSATTGSSKAGSCANPLGGDDDCVITSMEPAKSTAAATGSFAACKYLSPDWLADVKTSAQSLKSYMRKVETEETLKMQYWAKRREADERDLVARVTRNLKLAERELPVLPYKYEEPPPTPPTPEAEEEEFPELTKAQLDAVEAAWSRQLPGNEVLAEGFSLRVTREELRSLSGLNWLNDNVVNFYMQLIAARTGPGLARVHAYSTFFYTKLSSSGYAAVRRWTRKVDIFDRDVLLCPVHLHNNHWTLCIVDLRSRHIIFLDSLSGGGGRGNAHCLPLLRQYLVDEHRDKKGKELPDASEFKLVHEVGAPQQENGSDCGVFCCKFSDYYCKGREFTFEQANMPYFRKRITAEILEKRLLW